MAFVAPWSMTFCPFCCNSFHLSASPRRFNSGQKEPDTKVGQFLGTAPPDLYRVAPLKNGGFWTKLLRRFVVPDDWHTDMRKICPYDHMILPTATASGHLTSRVVAIIGTRASGKSNFFGVLLDALLRRYSSEVGFTMFDQETFSVAELRPTSSDALYRRRYYSSLFGSSTPLAVPPNQASRVDPDLRIPLIYRMEFPRRGWRDFLLPRRALDLVIFDSAGEDLRDDDPQTLEQFYRFLLHAAGIIFLIDPTQVKGIRARLSQDIQDQCPEVSDDAPDRLLSRVINLFQRRRGLAPGRGIRIPVAFAFSKSDLLRGVVDRQALLHHDSTHQGGFNWSNCRQVSEEVTRCLTRWGEDRLVNLIEGKFDDYAFFALSALGQTPDSRTRKLSGAVSSVRIADPLLWILWRSGYIPETSE